MGHLIDDMLALARVSRVEMERASVDLSALSHRIVAELKRLSPERHVNVSIAPNMTVTGDEHLLSVALENLIGNAWKFTSQQPEATVEIGEIGGDSSRTSKTTARGSIRNMRRSSLARFSDCTRARSTQAQASAAPPRRASCIATAAGVGPKARVAKARRFTSRCLERSEEA